MSDDAPGGRESGGGQPGGPAQPEASTSSAAAPAPVDYEALYDQIKDKPCRVVQINQRLDGFSGGKFRTRAALLERELEPIYKAETLADVHHELDAAGRRLKQLGVFSDVNFLAHEEPLDDPSACTVDLQLEELNWFKLRAATYVQGGESTFELGAGMANASGNAERFDANLEYGTENSHTASVSYSQPRLAGLPLVLELRGSQLFRNNQKASSFTEQLRGVVLGLKSMSGVHGLEYEIGWRRLLDPSRTASKAVVAQMGDYLKSSLRYTATIDHREPGAGGSAATLGGAGWAVRSTSEVAGLAPGSGAASGTLRFVRQQLDAVANVPMDDTGAVVFSLGLTAGLLFPWGDDALLRPTCIADRFFLGGASSLRGFKFKGAGPTDVRRPAPRTGSDEQQQPRRDALGGDAYTSIFASLMFQLPHPALQLLKVHGHAFVNGGNVVQLAGTGRSPGAMLSELGSTFRWSCGLGLVIPTPMGRFEANYCVVMAAQEHDRVRRGLQLGFAASSL
ncbi:Sorting and assembly machinery component 50 A [Tetrabaena socialis]|uniref:Sorting and assembly machinery component 50 A n=1 Tax=Tetrabaena socialis TaxID=47790 RepID=A0A2J8A342_9CHLO|nr:Sorting and assembly machinery component 50 A [Tetrabaena socialis]|eukprot:PNH06935.1 Sorting and assembly machinery component 50 A [Tetrabaena socialis]